MHRDIKPGNVMLGKFGETLVVDWGLAKSVGRTDDVLNTGDAEGTLAPGFGSSVQPTLAGSRLGTPSYMSPEQAAGRLDRLGPASDVYSLGATLYYLLVGKSPFEGSDLVAVLRQVERGEFPRPCAANMHVDPALESICLKAMAVEPEARYPSARALAVDVEHWLADEPVSTYREPILLRLRRWARRHRTAVAIGAGVLQTTVVVLAVSTWLLSQSRARIERERRVAVAARDTAEQERQKANLALNRVEAVNSFLVKDLLEQANPELGGGGGTMTLGEAVKRSVAALDARATSFRQPEIEAAIRGTIGDAYNVIENPKEAVEQLRKAKKLLDQSSGSDPLQSVWTTNRLANALFFADSAEEALALYRQAAEQSKGVLGPEHPETAYALGGVGVSLHALGQGGEAITYLQQAASILERTVGPGDRRTQAELNNLVLALAYVNRIDEAESLGRRVLALRIEWLGPSHMETVLSRHNLARVLLQKGEYSEALPLQARAVEESTQILGPNNFRTLFMTNNLGAALEGTGQVDRAEEVLRTDTRTAAEDPWRPAFQYPAHDGFSGPGFVARRQARGGPIVWRADSPAAGTHGGRPGEGSRFGSRCRRTGRDGRDVGCRADSARADCCAGAGILAGRLVHGLCRSLLGGCLLRAGRTEEAASMLNESVKAMEAARIAPGALIEKARKRAGLVAQKLK